jgi:UDP-N-acetylmuramate dehydrogenase
MDAALLESLIAERTRPRGPESGWQEGLRSLVRGELRLDEPLKRYTSIQIGGPADAYVIPTDLEDLRQILIFAEERRVPWMVLGLGSNVLIKDGGIRGIVLRLQRFNRFEVIDETATDLLLEAQAGVPLPKLVEFSRQRGLEGMEYLYGIPASVGGALWMNAGTRQGEIKDCVVELTMLRPDGSTLALPQSKLKFEYRDLKLPGRGVIVSAKFRLKKGNPEEVEAKISAYQKKRHDTQPLDFPSVGSVFKNPPKAFAAQLIDELGFKGVRVGGARVSPKHANFIINEDQATARDVLILIGLIKDKVRDELDVRLEPEVKVLGEDESLPR